jgi:Raf kinase inhibitor-like YbhB/YbcL family protein
MLAQAFLLAGTPCAFAAPAPPLFQGPALAQDRVLARAVADMQVTSTALGADNALPLSATGYGRSTSFPVSWIPVPGAKSYAVVFEELDPQQPRAVVYWLVYNIPHHITSLGHAVHNKAVIAGPDGFMQGLNTAGGIGYIGPRPPVGDAPHQYHLEVFALGRILPIKGGEGIDKLVSAMNDRVIAEGRLVATYQAPRPGENLPGGASNAHKP